MQKVMWLLRLEKVTDNVYNGPLFLLTFNGGELVTAIVLQI